MPALLKVGTSWRPSGAGTAVTPGGEDPPPAAPEGVLTLHATQADLDEMRSRVTSGPFHTANNPVPWGDWTRIVEDKNRFMNNPTASRWDGPTANNPGGHVKDNNTRTIPTYLPHIGEVADLRNAAFYAWVIGSGASAVATQVATILNQQVNYNDTVFTNRTRWSLTQDSSHKSDQTPCWQIANWAIKMLSAYDYIKAWETENSGSLFTAQQDADLKAWHEGLAAWYMPRLSEQFDSLYTNRATYSTSSEASQIMDHAEYRYRDASGVASKPHKLAIRLNNRDSCVHSYVGLVGIRFDNDTFRNEGIRWVKEYIRFGAYPDDTIAEWERCRTSDSAQGVKYGCETGGPILSVAHALWTWDGDAQLFTESTSTGLGDTAGGPKSLKTICLGIHRHTDNTYLRYVGNGGTVGNESHRIKMGLNDNRWHDGHLILMEHYLRAVEDADADLFRDYYMRYKTGQAAMPDPPQQSQGDPRGGAWETHPAMLFCFGRT